MAHRSWIAAALVAAALSGGAARAGDLEDTVRRLEAENAVLRAELAALAERVAALEGRLRKHADGPHPGTATAGTVAAPPRSPRRVSLNVAGARIGDVLVHLAIEYDLNIVVPPPPHSDRLLTIRLRDVPVMEAFEQIVKAADLGYAREGDVLRVQPGGSGRSIDLTINHSTTLRFPGPITRIALGDPEVVEIVALTEQEVLVNGRARGLTNAIVFLANGEREEIPIRVGRDLSQLREALKQIDDGIEVSEAPTNGAIILKGYVDEPSTVARAKKLVEGFLKDGNVSEGGVVNLLRVGKD